MRTTHIDRIDLRILNVLQSEGRISNQRLAKRIALSASACLSRVRALEASGVITGYHASVALATLRPTVTVYAEVSMKHHAASDIERFDAVLLHLPEIVEATRMSGPYDYLIKVMVTDMVEWDELADILLSEATGVDRIETHIVFANVKPFVGVPLVPSSSSMRRLSTQLHPSSGRRKKKGDIIPLPEAGQ